ncbi:ankyrin repeat domain-containing protein [Dyadobacter sp. 3J3]|uniref:ankyrin repeat domain-containing protein n=1 Tax=Dyadobacter sp. 3J3 TaxID=2606600 RepID=UPI00135C0778|nr:ankyrin repeat domain-containing protein [Dyadobacter sp. 3J3]
MGIFDAARNNNVVEIKSCLKYTEINARDGRGSTPLILAAYYNNAEAAEALLIAGADIELCDRMGNTALMGACFKGYIRVAQLLIHYGASVETVNGNEATALTFAATFGHDALIELLLANGANPLKKDLSGRNPIDHALIQENAQCYELMVAATKSMIAE